MVAATVHPRASELLGQMAGGNLYRRAAQEGMPLSAWLEREDPSDERDGLDAFGRMMRAAGIVTRSDPSNGYWSDRFEAFDADDNKRALVPEFVRRVWIRAAHPDPKVRVLYSSNDGALGGLLQPYADNAVPRYQQIAPAIPLSEVVAVTTPIDSDAYRAFYLTGSTTQQRMARVAQGAELPRFKLTGSDHTIRLHKYGGALEISYEALRRMRIDLVALHIARIAVQAETDKVADAIDVIVNGDGNSSTAATSYNLTTLDSGTTANNITMAAWIAFKLKFANPYAMTTMFAQDTVAAKAMLLNAGSANIPLVALPAASGFGQFTPINPQLADGVRLGVTSDAPANKIVGIDRRFALEYVTEVGGDISEIERWATRQVQVLTLSEVNGFAVLDQNASKVMATNA